MSKIHQTCHGVTVYHNEQDVALTISDLTKGHPDRLGHRGAARPTLTHHRIHQVDCTTVVHRGFTEHSYYLTGRTNEDIRMTVRDLPFDDASRSRKRHERFENVWKFG